MVVFECAGCGDELTVPVARVELPDHAHQKWGNGPGSVGPLLEAGTFAVESGTGVIAVGLGDVRGTRLIPERYDGSCCGLSAGHGPNMACAGCGLAVAALVDDCGLWQAVWLVPDAVRAVACAEPDPVVDWHRPSWDGCWSWRWEAALAVTLAHLVVASAGAPLSVAGERLADTFSRALGEMLPREGRPRTVALSGPGLPETGADIAVTPRHPRTGELWLPGAVPMAADVWTHMAFHNQRLMLPATGVLPEGVLRDEAPPTRPWTRWFDQTVFFTELDRMSVDEPWLREIRRRIG